MFIIDRLDVVSDHGWGRGPEQDLRLSMVTWSCHGYTAIIAGRRFAVDYIIPNTIKLEIVSRYCKLTLSITTTQIHIHNNNVLSTLLNTLLIHGSIKIQSYYSICVYVNMQYACKISGGNTLLAKCFKQMNVMINKWQVHEQGDKIFLWLTCSS